MATESNFKTYKNEKIHPASSGCYILNSLGMIYLLIMMMFKNTERMQRTLRNKTRKDTRFKF